LLSRKKKSIEKVKKNKKEQLLIAGGKIDLRIWRIFYPHIINFFLNSFSMSRIIFMQKGGGGQIIF
jgi:hypothetical protein